MIENNSNASTTTAFLVVNNVTAATSSNDNTSSNEDHNIRSGCYNQASNDNNEHKNIQTIEKENENDKDKDLSYWKLLCINHEFRLLLFSYLISHLGEWLTYIASLDFIEEYHQTASSANNKTLISILVIIRLIPNVIMSSCLGGILADVYDKRHVMILLDVCGSISSIFFIIAYNMKSLPLIYIATFVQECIAGLYQPNFSSMIPMTTKGDDIQLQKATTLSGIVWSSMVMIGSSLGGLLVSTVGSNNCFCKYNKSFRFSEYIVCD